MKSESSSVVAPLRGGEGTNRQPTTAKPRPSATQTRHFSTAASPTVQVVNRPAASIPSAPSMPKWPFFAADVVLLAATGVLLGLSHRPWSPGLLLLASLLVILGGVVAVLPFMMTPRPRTSAGTADAPKPHPKLRITLH